MNHPVNRRWSMRQRDWAVVFWISFLAATAGAFILFGLLNPLDMIGFYADQYDIGVRLAYGLTFAFLYAVCLLAAAMTMFMIRTGPTSGHASGRGRRAIPTVHDPSTRNPDLDLDSEDWQ